MSAGHVLEDKFGFIRPTWLPRDDHRGRSAARVIQFMTTSVAWFAALYAAFAVKHFLADFILQSDWMAAGKEQARGWAVPLAAHAGCHAALTLLLVLVTAPALWWLGPVDFVVHGGIDRAKGLVSRRLNLKPNEARWWWVFGADQLLHHLTHLAFIVLIVAM